MHVVYNWFGHISGQLLVMVHKQSFFLLQNSLTYLLYFLHPNYFYVLFLTSISFESLRNESTGFLLEEVKKKKGNKNKKCWSYLSRMQPCLGRLQTTVLSHAPFHTISLNVLVCMFALISVFRSVGVFFIFTESFSSRLLLNILVKVIVI